MKILLVALLIVVVIVAALTPLPAILLGIQVGSGF